MFCFIPLICQIKCQYYAATVAIIIITLDVLLFDSNSHPSSLFFILFLTIFVCLFFCENLKFVCIVPSSQSCLYCLRFIFIKLGKLTIFKMLSWFLESCMPFHLYQSYIHLNFNFFLYKSITLKNLIILWTSINASMSSQ